MPDRTPHPPETFAIVDELHHHPPIDDPPLALRAAIRAAFLVADAGSLADRALYAASNAVSGVTGNLPGAAIDIAEGYALARWCRRSPAEALIYAIRHRRTVPNVTSYRTRAAD